MSSDELRLHSWGIQQEESDPSTASFSSSCRVVLTLIVLSVVNPLDLGCLANMDSDIEEVRSHGKVERILEENGS